MWASQSRVRFGRQLRVKPGTERESQRWSLNIGMNLLTKLPVALAEQRQVPQ